MNNFFEFTRYPKSTHKYDPTENQIFYEKKILQKNNSELTVISRESLEIKGNHLSKQKRQSSAETLKLQKDSNLSKKSNAKQNFNNHFRQTSQDESFELEERPKDEVSMEENFGGVKSKYEAGKLGEFNSKMSGIVQLQEKRIHQKPYFIKSAGLTRVYSANLKAKLIKNLVKIDSNAVAARRSFVQSARNPFSVVKKSSQQEKTLKTQTSFKEKKFLLSKQEIDNRMWDIHKKFLVEEIAGIDNNSKKIEENEEVVINEENLKKYMNTELNPDEEVITINKRNKHVHQHLIQLDKKPLPKKNRMLKSAQNPFQVEESKTKPLLSARQSVLVSTGGSNFQEEKPVERSRRGDSMLRTASDAGNKK